MLGADELNQEMKEQISLVPMKPKRKAMQRSNKTKVDSESNHGTTSSSEEQQNSTAQESKSDPQIQGSKSAASIEVEPGKSQTEEQNAKKHSQMNVATPTDSQPGTQSETESCKSPTENQKDLIAKPSAPAKQASNTKKSINDAKNAKKKDKVVKDRKYVMSKKAMIDPLKIDMSKPALPLSSSELSLQCIECHIIFSDHKSKERHLKLSHPAQYEESVLRNSFFACYVCDRHFTNSTELMTHQKAHIEKKPFKCPICDLAFKKSSELTLHKKIHYGVDGYVCTACGKSCKTLTLLRYHQRKHTGERPYVCKDCGIRFTMSKALQKHAETHLGEGTGGTAKKEQKKDAGASTTRYPCSLCKATFKSLKTRLNHIKTKHNPFGKNVLPTKQQVKRCEPIVTPISISQPALLQLEANGPLQKVDENIDTEPIRKLIELLGNVQKVNQVVILGQVPPHAPPLQLQQFSQSSDAENLDLPATQMNFMGPKQIVSKDGEQNHPSNPCDPMEQTIILEPITPDGEPANPCYSALGPQNIELTLVEAEQTERPEKEAVVATLQQPGISSVQTNLMVGKNNVCNSSENLEEMVILELTPALTPTLELEQSQTEHPSEIPSSSPMLNTPQEIIAQTVDQTVINDQQAGQSIPPLMPTVELELRSLHPEQENRSSCPFASSDALTNGSRESDSNSKGDIDPHAAIVGIARTPGSDEKTLQKPEQEQSEKLPINNKNKIFEGHGPSANNEASSPLQSKQVALNSDLPISVMSAQELVKVRKRKPSRTFIFQGNMQDFAGSIYRDDFRINEAPPKRQRAKKSHLIVKFGPQNKDSKSKKQKKSTEKVQPLSSKASTKKVSEKKVPSQNKGGKGKKSKTKANLESEADNKSTSTQSPEVQKIKDVKGKRKMKKGKIADESVANTSELLSVAQPVLKKKKQAKKLQQDQSKNAKGEKSKKNLARKEQLKQTIVLDPHITQDSLLLLKGHKQPQLKVFKLDPSKASGQTPEASPTSSQTTSPISRAESTKNLSLKAQKKGGKTKKNQKALSLLSSLKVSRQPAESVPTKPKISRKRKSLNVETEGVITSKCALQCKDCGERFSEVSSLQKHKTSAHMVESPSLTYTNGNIFEGVSRLDLYQFPKEQSKVVHAMNAATDWDIEPEPGEIALEDRERAVSFPALIPSPSLQIPSLDIEMGSYEGKGGNKTGAEIQSSAPTEFSDKVKSTETQQSVPTSTATQTKASEMRRCFTSEEDRQEDDPSKISESEFQSTKDEDVKEDLLLDIDLVTVGEQDEVDDPVSTADTLPQSEADGNCNLEVVSVDKHPEQVSDGTTNKNPTSHTVSCSTHQMEIKEEEEETLVEKKEEGRKRIVQNPPRGRRKSTGYPKRGAKLKRNVVQDVLERTESQDEVEDCQVVYEKHFSAEKTNCAQMNPEHGASKVHDSPLRSIPTTIEESNRTTLLLESQTTNTEEGEENDRESDQSPVIILERFFTSGQSSCAEKESCSVSLRNIFGQSLEQEVENMCQMTESQEIKEEESGSDPLLATSTCSNRLLASVQPQRHRDVRTVLVKEESSYVLNNPQVPPQASKHFQWNLEPVSNDNRDIPFLDSGESRKDPHISPEFCSNHCIFYPVKDEDREVLMGATQDNEGNSTPDRHSYANQIEHLSADSDRCEERHSSADHQEMSVGGLGSQPEVIEFADRQEVPEWQNSSNLRDFLLSSDERDSSEFALSDPHLNAEAEVMAAFSKKQTRNGGQPDQISNGPTTMSCIQEPRQANTTLHPIDYFSKYFGWDTWVEISTCTNELSDSPNPVTCREVARFAGIHIAMGTLKFPSPRLYWEDFTKVPLIAEAIPLQRFHELSRILRLSSPSNDPSGSSDNAQQNDKAFKNSCRVNSQHEEEQFQDSSSNNVKQTDPLCKIQPLLNRFNASCQPVGEHANFAIDQYSLPLTGKISENRPSLLCTTMIGFGGLLSNVDLKLDFSDKEDAVRKLVPRGSMVFLCKRELSTPAMLECLLAAGIHGAGRVGGARGQIGDEFVSSDGKLMLHRSHCGFILSTAGNRQSNLALLVENFETAQKSARLHRDLLNLYSIPLTATAPTCWPQAVLWHFVDAALVNSWLLYCEDNKTVLNPLSLMDFRLEVSKALILSSGSDNQDSVPPQPPSETTHTTSETPNSILLEDSPLPDAAMRYDGSGHWPEQVTEGEGGRCRFGDCQRTSRVLCLKCCVFLCISQNHNCFLNFHNEGSLWKK